jgi:hypothetical protein
MQLTQSVQYAHEWQFSHEAQWVQLLHVSHCWQ